VLHVDDLMAGQHADATTRRFQELEVVEPVVNALQQTLRYTVARQLLLGKEDVALFLTQAEEVIAVDRIEELVGEGRLVQREQVRAMRDPHQPRWQMLGIQQ
jgi:hypothetical protein